MIPSSGLFVADIPQYLTDEQFQNLWANVEGLKDARLRRDKKDRVVGFVDFETKEQAARARDQFQGYSFLKQENGISIHFTKSKPNPRKHSEADEHSSYGSSMDAGDLQIRIPHDDMMNGINNTGYHDDINKARNRRRGSSSSSYSASRLPIGQRSNSRHMYNQNSPPRSTLYVEGIPIDATEREVSHVFRHYQGFKSVRLFEKSGKKGDYILCFVEYDNQDNATNAMNALQGYRFDPKIDHRGIAIRYAHQRGQQQVSNNTPSPTYSITPTVPSNTRSSPNPIIESPILGFNESFTYDRTNFFNLPESVSSPPLNHIYPIHYNLPQQKTHTPSWYPSTSAA